MTDQLDSRDFEVVASEAARARDDGVREPDVWKSLPQRPSFAVSEKISYGEVSAADVEGLPLQLVQMYAEIAVRHAIVREAEPGAWWAAVAGIDGAWGDGKTPDEACRELYDAIIGWVAVKRRIGARDIPLLEGIDLNPPM